MKPKNRRNTTGFTLSELMVTLSVAAVLAMIAVPSFQTYARNAAVAQVSGHFVHAAQLARANAMRSSRHTLVQVLDENKGWIGGWRVYADLNRDLAYTAGTDVLIAEQAPAPAGVMTDGDNDKGLDNRGTAANGYLMFNPAGFPRTSTDGIAAGSLVFYVPQGRATSVVYSNAGRIRRCDPTKTGCRS
jgi:prepilin-type N-terminal cleavage/methylation domain-containing protein